MCSMESLSYSGSSEMLHITTFNISMWFSFILLFSSMELYTGFVHGIHPEGGSTGLSVLRTFRLLRILKLVRFLPNLRRQLVVMLRTMDNVAVFFGLLMLFIFIFRLDTTFPSLAIHPDLSPKLGINYANSASQCSCKECQLDKTHVRSGAFQFI